jgi:hypothetical protein
MPYRIVPIEIGDKFGRLTVISIGDRIPCGISTAATWTCRCECGNIVSRRKDGLLRPGVKSCGCFIRDIRVLEPSRRTHGESNRNLTPEYRSWKHMLRRCTSPKNPAYGEYGGRGITVCDEWLHSYETFLRDMGRKPTPLHSIDRKENDGPYAPDNCRWATKSEQSNNRRNVITLEFQGKRQTITQWARDMGINDATLRDRIKKFGYSPEMALTKPVKTNGLSRRKVRPEAN